jgi:DNA-binding response OmpR family regulator
MAGERILGERILILDDDAAVLAAVELTLQKAGYTVETTSQVFGLPAIVGKFNPDLILLDFDLPALTGDKLAVSLQGLRPGRACPIVFHSAESEALLARSVRETGAQGYIPKGLPRADFLGRVKGFLKP